MRKLFRLMLAVCLVIVLSAEAFALDQATYQIDELDMCMDLPTDYVVFTRKLEEDDPNLSAYGLTKNEMLSLMEDRSIYLNAWDREIRYEIVVTMTESECSDFSQLGDVSLSAVLSELEAACKEIGVTYIRSEQYQHDQTKFIKIYTSQPNGESTAYGLQYSTVYAGKAINITMQSYSGEIDSEKESILKTIVDSVHFGTEPMQSESPAETPSFTYEDEECGVVFTVPANWTERPAEESAESVDAQFISNFDEERCMFYGSTDLWSQLSDSEKQGSSRAEVDNSIFTKKDIAEQFGIAEEKVSVVTYGGKEYYQAEYLVSGTAYGLNFSVETTCLFRCENGYMYTFQFTGLDGDTYYEDFEALLRSVQYRTAAAAVEENTEDEWSRSWIASLLLGLLFTVMIHPLPICIYRYAIKKEPLAPRKAKIVTVIDAVIVFCMTLFIASADGSRVSSGAVVFWSFLCYRILTKGYSDAACGRECGDADLVSGGETCLEAADVSFQEEPEDGKALQQKTTPRFCHQCGKALSPGSLFCSQCGTKIPQ